MNNSVKWAVQHTRLADDAGVTLVDIQVRRNVLPELLEDEGASGEVKGGEVWAREHLTDYSLRGARDELDNARRDASLGEDLVSNVVRVDGTRRRFPDDGVADQCRGYSSCCERSARYRTRNTHLQEGSHR